MTKLLIGVSGRAGAGKDAFALMLKDALEKQGFKVFTAAFADPVKTIYKSFFEGDPYTNDRYIKEQMPVPRTGERTMRYILSMIGTEFGRDLIHPDLWIWDMQRRMKQFSTLRKEVLIVTDIRMVNELRMMQEHGATIFDIYRFESKPSGWLKRLWSRITGSPAQKTHRTEALHFRKYLDPINDHIVYNEGTLEDLQRVAAGYAEHQVGPALEALCAEQLNGDTP